MRYNKLIPAHKTLLCVLAFFGVSKTLFSQCSSDGPRNATVFASQSFTGSDYSWSNPSNAASSDNSRATASAVIGLLSGQTEYLTATGFGFNISAAASICGIKVEVEKSGSNLGLGASIQDYSIRLIKNNVITGNDLASGTDWTGTDGYGTYGGNSSTWGVTWSVTDINSANFGVAFSAQINGTVSLLATARLDHIRVTVYYSAITLPIQLISFDAKEVNSKVELEWGMAATNEEVGFIIQRSADGNSWNDIENLFSTLQSPGDQHYSYTDKQPLQKGYYRLKVIVPSGEYKFSEIQKIELKQYSHFLISPNPAKDKIVISNLPAFPVLIKIYDVAGTMVMQHNSNGGEKIVDISALRGGTYFTTIADGEGKQQRGFVFVKLQQ
jgi:Secretion system C-terminal sorting domain